jgi:lipoprotein signal peptidase
MIHIHRRALMALYVMALVAVGDQLSKWWIVHVRMIPTPRVLPVTPFLNFVLVWNKGVTFGLLNQVDRRFMPWVLVAAAVLVLFLLGRWLWRTSSAWVAVALGAIMGGAIGNIVDRARFGAVIDFLDFYYGDYHWYAFNIADAAIVTGVGLLLLDSLVRAK